MTNLFFLGRIALAKPLKHLFPLEGALTPASCSGFKTISQPAPAAIKFKLLTARPRQITSIPLGLTAFPRR